MSPMPFTAAAIRATLSRKISVNCKICGHMPSWLRLRARDLLLLVLCTGLLPTTFTGTHIWGDDWAMYVQQARLIAEGRPLSETRYIWYPEAAHIAPPAYPVVFPLLLTPVFVRYGLNINAFVA